MLRCKTVPLTEEQTHDYISKRLKIAGAGDQPIFSSEAMDAVHLYSLGIPRVVNLLCEHSLVNSYVDQQRPIKPKTVEDVAREFQLDEVEPVAASHGTAGDLDVYNSEAFIQNLGEALSRFRIGPTRTSSRERK
jgi:hypothetical protein